MLKFLYYYLRISLVLLICSFSIKSHAQSQALSLEFMISQALRTYPSILSREASKEAAESDVISAKLKFLPSPSISTQMNQVTYTGTDPSNLPSKTITISQPLYMGGALMAGYKKAGARLSAADYSILETREDVAKRLVTYYVEWLKSWTKIQALEENVKLHEKFVGIINRRFQQGVAASADADLAVSRLEQAKSDLDSQYSLEDNALNSISELVGSPVTRAQLIPRMALPVVVPRRKDGIEKAISSSVSIQRLKFEAESAQEEATEAKALALPQASFQVQKQIGNPTIPGMKGYDLYGFVLSYAPGGGGLSALASANAAKDRARAALIQVDAAKRDLADRLNSEYNDYEFSKSKRDSLKRSSDLSAEISASYDRQFLVGRKSWLELMNAVRENAQTLVALADAEGSVLGASRRLKIYIDGSLQFDDSKP